MTIRLLVLFLSDFSVETARFDRPLRGSTEGLLRRIGYMRLTSL